MNNEALNRAVAEKIFGCWYDAMGGLGLQVKRGDGGWRTAGYIQRKGKSWDIRINPYQDEGFTLSSHRSLEDAKTEFLRWARVTEVVLEAA